MDQMNQKKTNEWSQLVNYEPIERALNELNFNEPTEIQRRALPVSIELKRDVLGAAPTGSNHN